MLMDEAEQMAKAGEEDLEEALCTLEIPQIAYLPEEKKYMDWRSLSRSDRLKSATHTFKVAEAQLQKDSKRAKKLEDKLDRVFGGYMSKSKQAIKSIQSCSEDRESIAVEIEVFKMLHVREEQAIK